MRHMWGAGAGSSPMSSAVNTSDLLTGRRGMRYEKVRLYHLVWLPIVILLVLGRASLAHATSSFYWYGENNSTCWQTGQLGSASLGCDTVGAGFLSSPGGYPGGLAHMVEVTPGGIAEDIKLPTDGDYCNYYKVGDYISDQETNNQSGYTGYLTPTPFGSYQERDAHGDVCQANGANWGQEVHNGVSGNKCYETCGMHHFVSFHEQGLNDRPWASWFGEPSLTISTEANAQTVTFSGESPYNGAWGYVCPVLEDTTTGYVLEYCLEEWRSIYNESSWKDERIGTCSGGEGALPLDTIVTYFWPGTEFATEQAGSSNTFEFAHTPSGWMRLAATITKADLINAINLDKKEYLQIGEHKGSTELGYGCGLTNLSTNPENYALIGLEQGVEGWHKVSGLGGSARNLELRTEYTPLPPSVSTGAASGVTQSQATLNGTVNPNGVDTHYYFQYGTTTGYGSNAPALPGGDAGSGTSSRPVGITVSPLEQGTVYHYRLVASGSAGTTYSKDTTFTTLNMEASPLWVSRNPVTGDMWVYDVNSKSEIAEWAWDTASWGEGTIGGTAAAGTTPSVVHDQTTGDTWVYYVNSKGEIAEWNWNGSMWHGGAIGGSVKSGTSPAVVRDPVLGDTWVYYLNSKSEMAEWNWNGSMWHSGTL